MGHYAKVKNNLVIDVIVAEQEYIDTLQNKEFYYQTSYNISGGVYYDPTTNQPHADQSLIELELGRKRKNYAVIGYTYDENRDAFIPPKPYGSWVLDENTCGWEAPIPYPNDNKEYMWNEVKKEWTYTGYYFENGEVLKEE
jgi:hypothetical protein